MYRELVPRTNASGICTENMNGPLENRGRRNNLVFYGVPESSGKEVCVDALKEVLKGFVGLSDADFTVERKIDGRKPFFPYPAKLAYRLHTGKLQIVE